MQFTVFLCACISCYWLKPVVFQLKHETFLLVSYRSCCTPVNASCIFAYILMSVHTPVVISNVLKVQLYTQVYLLALEVHKTYI
jgi:hypothetical protein